jgi:CubicO group peptidase (beta-lactamase class C family)
LILAVVGLAGLVSFSGPQARPAERLLEALQAQTGAPGMAAAVARDGEVIWRSEVGLADVEKSKPVGPDTIFRLASVSKAVCSVIAAKLLEEGRLSLDARVGELLPRLPRQYKDILFRDLMTHSSGLPHYQPRDAGRGRRHYESALQGLAELGDRPLAHDPGTTYLYSTHGFSLASAMMEAAAGQTFSDLFAKLVSGNEAGARITLERLEGTYKDRSEIYAGNRGGAPRRLVREDFSYSWCGAGMQSSAASLARFGASLFGQRSLLGVAGQALIRQPLAGRSGESIEGDRWLMTLGWRLGRDHRGDPIIHHAGVTNGARSILAVWPEKRLAAVMLSNASWTGRMAATAEALALAATASVEARACPPRGSAAYRGSLAGEALEAQIEWRAARSDCTGLMSGENALSDWVSRFNFAEVSGFPLIRLAGQRWVLVTPIGGSILTGDASRLQGMVGSRPLELVRQDGPSEKEE